MNNDTEHKKVAIVTGGDRGIGFQVCRRLGELGFQVVLTSPDPARGQAAAEKLKNAGLAVAYRVLDLLNDRHPAALRSFVMKKFGRVDVLVNNAGISLDAGMSKMEGLVRRKLKKTPRKMDYGEGPGILETDMGVMRATLEVNTLGALKMCQTFVPLMIKARYGRVVNISSTLGQLKDMTDEEKVPAYQLSKTALNAVTKMTADACRGKNVAVNSVCPGWTRTDLGGPQAPQSPEEASKDIVWLATQPDNGPTGQFFQHRRRIPW
ncbi:MAG: SDR family NAD(P)-dependent oxidoreductase [Candidatus Omnitrophica bacterium]|nr:SDR family NAD(P)-dependent oxidoreductase [Candidatus Omnitrophota bacterium]MDD5538729.1 SDR family NAD(P)-dependent oxidoreductase [Candidatus Omnitrophota bacterium]